MSSLRPYSSFPFPQCPTFQPGSLESLPAAVLGKSQSLMRLEFLPVLSSVQAWAAEEPVSNKQDYSGMHTTLTWQRPFADIASILASEHREEAPCLV